MKNTKRNASFSSDPFHLLPTKENESSTLFLSVLCNAKKNVAFNTEDYFYCHIIIRIEQFKNICNYLGSEMECALSRYYIWHDFPLVT